MGASWVAVNKSPTIRERFDHIVRDDPDRRKIAIVAVAHWLSRVALAMLRSGEPWRESVIEPVDGEGKTHQAPRVFPSPGQVPLSG